MSKKIGRKNLQRIKMENFVKYNRAILSSQNVFQSLLTSTKFVDQKNGENCENYGIQPKEKVIL